MFLDKKFKKDDVEKLEYFSNDRPIISNNKVIFYVIFIVFALLIIGISYFVVSKPPVKTVVNILQDKSKLATSSVGLLPGNIGDGLLGDSGTTTLADYANAEYITFGDFYAKSNDNFVSTLESYDLPINLKIDVANYYEISRKIELDSSIDQLNDNGFAVVNNQFVSTANDFFDVYRLLMSKDIPVVVTNDFILYYYQNYLKEVYKEIEKNIFYENVWNINKKLFDISLTRYKNRLTEVGLTNDIILEAARLETAYFAVALKLLMPLQNQINKDPNLINGNKFSQQEVDEYYVGLPEFLKIDVDKEVSAIRRGEGYEKSAVLRYFRNYKYFNVPKNYSDNAKLNNFYLSMRWLNTVFPLYYKSENCEDCLLDYDDWKINMASANFIAEDIYNDSEIKKRWAIIYKFIAFFSGLKADLTYLNYRDVMIGLFGEDYNIENIFSPDNKNRDNDLVNMQEKIADFSFLPIEGNLSRDDIEVKPFLGMRILQENYWPNDYIFSQLTGNNLSYGGSENKKDNLFTLCSDKSSSYRCRGTAMDIINLLQVKPELIENKYFSENINYNNYSQRVDNLKSQLSDFNVNSWNNNIYWVTLDVIKYILGYDIENQPVFMKNSQWYNKRAINTALGAWVNLHLPEDKLINYYEKNENYLGSYTESFDANYIEPNLELIKELIAKNNMLVEMLKVFNVTEKTNAVSVQLRDLSMKLNDVLAICKKELSGELLNDDDFRFINDFVRHYKVDEEGEKSFNLFFEKNRNVNESIDGVKLLILIYKNKQDGKNTIAIGPVFNYWEK